MTAQMFDRTRQRKMERSHHEDEDVMIIEMTRTHDVGRGRKENNMGEKKHEINKETHNNKTGHDTRIN